MHAYCTKTERKIKTFDEIDIYGKLHKIGTQKKRKEVVIRRNYQSS